MLPTIEECGVSEGTKYFHKVICEFISQGNKSEYDRLYYRTLASEVWQYLAIRKAVNYIPKENQKSLGGFDEQFAD